MTSGKVCEPMAEGWKKLLANGRGGEISAPNSRGREERVFRDNSEREGCNCERRKMSERRKIYEDVSGANIRISFTLKKCECFNHL